MTPYHIIKDPVHGSMQFTQEENDWIKPFIDSENFQRLRQIKQLGLTDWIFPGATHTRFNHSLGCCYVASQIANKLGFSAHDKQSVMLACLLHDIGHGPFSHSFENIFHHKSIKHEMWTVKFIEEYQRPEFLIAFQHKNPSLSLTEQDLIVIKQLIMGHSKAVGQKTMGFERSLLTDIVSSQLDADRLDYLLRDSHFCGVNYGEYDFRWLLHCLAIVDQDGEQRLGITKKGIGAIEHYLSARRLMFRNIYQHGKKYGSEIYLQEFLKQLSIALVNEPVLVKSMHNPLANFLRQLYLFNYAAETTKDIPSLIQKFIDDNYHLYSKLCDYDVLAMIRELANWDLSHPVITLAKRLHQRKLPKVWQIAKHKIDSAEQIFIEWQQSATEFAPWQIMISRLPSLSYEKGHDPILIADGYHQGVGYLHDDSLMVDALANESEDIALIIIDAAIIQHAKVQQLYNHLRESGGLI